MGEVVWLCGGWGLGLHWWAQGCRACKCQAKRFLPFFLNTILFPPALLSHVSSPCPPPSNNLKKEKEKVLCS